MKKNIHPLQNNVLIDPKELSKDKTESGIFLPENASEEKPHVGKVVAVGDSDEIKVKKNQEVIYTRYSGTEIEVDGKEYLIVKNKDILAVIE